MKKVCSDPFFDLFIILCIVVNTGFMAIDQKPASEEFQKIVDTANIVST